MKFGSIIVDYPAYSVHDPVPQRVYDLGRDVPVFKDRDTVRFPFVSKVGRYKGQTFWKEFSFGSVASYALENQECPIKAYNKAVENGHKTHWLNGCAVSITNQPQAKVQYVGLHFGEKFWFEGRLWTAEPDHNDNVKMIEVEI